MRRGNGFALVWHGLSCALVLLGFRMLVEADISCRSCQPGGKWRPRQLLLNLDPPVNAKGEVGERGQFFGVEHDCAIESDPECLSFPRRKRNTRAQEPLETARNETPDETPAHSARPGAILTQRKNQHARRMRTDSPGLRGDPKSRRARGKRSLRWSKDELQLTSSTFALRGDSAHNQAMVHWSGQNNSVSLITLFITKTLGFSHLYQP